MKAAAALLALACTLPATAAEFSGQVWPETRLSGTLEYRRTTGEAVALPFATALSHVFNHGTHHRGQVTAGLTALGQPCPVLDLVAMLQQEGQAG